jgi:hypothetical protein
MLRLNRLFPWPRRWLLWAAAGLLLCLLFICFPRPVDDDTSDYLELGHNLLHHGIYGLGSGADISPTLYRLPGYPIFLGLFELMFARIWPGVWMNAVFVVQAILSVTGCLLLACFARRHLSGLAAEVALALAVLCPFTSVYTGIAMAESLSIFAVALGIYAAGRALAAQQAGKHDLLALVCAGCASSLAMLLRPDGAILCIVLAAGLFGYTLRARFGIEGLRPALRRALAATALFCLVALLPQSVWTLRNWNQFHAFQPLAPRYINDPGTRYNAGLDRWYRTWTVEYVNTANVVWNMGSDRIDLADLPPRVFDSPWQRQQTLDLIADYNRTYSVCAELDARFAALAADRVRSHPFRYYVTLPLLRVADMLLRPRTEAFYLDVFWWRWSEHPGQTSWAILLGLINLGYVAAAAWAFLRGRVPWAWMLGGYLVLRFLLLATMENPEPRYTLECFPIFIVAAAAALTSRHEVREKPLLAQAEHAS